MDPPRVYITVTDRRDLHRPVRCVAKGARPGKIRTTDNHPTMNKDGDILTDDRILYFHTVRDALFLARRLPFDARRLLTIIGPRGPVYLADHNPGSHTHEGTAIQETGDGDQDSRGQGLPFGADQ